MVAAFLLTTKKTKKAMFKKARKKLKAAITKAATNIKKDIKKIKSGAKQLIKSVAKRVTKFYANAVFMPMLPLLGAMKHILKKNGISTKGMDLKDVAQSFYNNIVIKHKSFDNLNELDYEHFENLVEKSLYYDLESFENLNDETTEVAAEAAVPTESKEFDKAGLIGKGGGAAAGMAIGLPPQAGAAIGGALEKIIKAIVAFFKKGKQDKNKEVEEALAVETTEADVNEHATDLDGSGNAKSDFDIKKILFALGAIVLVIFAIKKFGK